MHKPDANPERLVQQVIATAHRRSVGATPLESFRQLSQSLSHVLAEFGCELVPGDVPAALVRSGVTGGSFLQFLQQLNAEGGMPGLPSDETVFMLGRVIAERQLGSPLSFSTDLGPLVYDEHAAFELFDRCQEAFGLRLSFAEFCRRLGVEMTPQGHPIFGVQARVLRLIRSVVQTAE